jgi:hypothetical protein
MVDPSDGVITRRAWLAGRLTDVIEADRRVERCKRIDFAADGAALVTVELVPDSDAKSRAAIARELEFALAQALPALAWARVQFV